MTHSIPKTTSGITLTQQLCGIVVGVFLLNVSATAAPPVINDVNLTPFPVQEIPLLAYSESDLLEDAAHVETSLPSTDQEENVDIPFFRPMPTPCSEDSSASDQDDLPWLDRTHLRLSQTLCNQVRRFDRFFGDVSYDEQYNSSFMRIRNAVAWNNRNTPEVKMHPRINAKIRLPNVENKFNLLIFDDNEDLDTLSSSRDATLENDPENQSRIATALRWVAQKKRAHELSFDLGAHLHNGLDTFVRSRYLKTQALSEDSHLRFSETLYWRQQEGFGERTQIDFDRSLSPDLIARWTNAATFSQNTNGIAWAERLTLFHQLDVKNAIAYSVGALGDTRPSPVVQDYGFSVRYRRDIYGHWLYTEVEPALNWPLEFDRKPTPGVTFRLEVQLGRNDH